MSTARVLSVIVVSAALAGCGKKKAPEPVAPIVGWHQEEGWMGACWFPPSFDGMGGGEARVARSESLDAMMAQWTGQRGDGVSFDETVATNVETQLLRFPDKIGQVAVDNLAKCRTAMAGGGTAAWSSWLTTLPRKLLEGECMQPLRDTMFWYVDLGQGWQFNAGVCAGEPVRITASANDYYQVDDKGPWINASGDPDKSTAGAAPGEYLCTVEGCFAGQLVLRWRGADGAEIVRPVGTSLEFNPPGHGTIEISVNDTSFFNNTFKIERGVQHRTQVTYAPAD